MSKQIFAIFNDEDVLMKSIKPLRGTGVNIKNVFSPFPIHGLDTELGLARTRISICSFMYGLTGLSLAIRMTDDRFVMQVELEDAATEAEVTAVLMKHGAEEVKEYGK